MNSPFLLQEPPILYETEDSTPIRIGNNISILYGSNSSCSGLTSDSYATECTFSLIFIWLTLGASVVGFIGNAQIAWCYGRYRGLTTNSDKLAFTYGLVETCMCISSFFASLFILITRNKAFCIFYVIYFILNSRTTLHLIVATAVNRYATSVRFHTHETRLSRLTKNIRPMLVVLLFATVVEIFLQGSVTCFKYENIGVLFIENYMVSERKNWSLYFVLVLDWMNWIILLAALVIAVIVYYKTREANTIGDYFKVEDPNYDVFYERAVTRMFRWNSLILLFALTIQVVIQILNFYATLNTINGVYFNIHFMILTKTIADFLSIMTVSATPIVFYSANAQFRSEVRVFWRYKMVVTREIYARLLQKSRSIRLQTGTEHDFEHNQEIARNPTYQIERD